MTDSSQSPVGSIEDPQTGLHSANVSIDALVREHHASIYRYVFWLVGVREAAEDITQETFVRAMRNINSLRQPEAAKGWLFVIARNEFSRWCSNRKNKPHQELTEAAEPSYQVSSSDDAEWLRCGMRTLTEEYRVVLVMYYFQDLSYAEISDQLDIPIGTVMSRMNRGRKRLKESLQQMELSTERTASEQVGGTNA